jgi:tetratricopeptide (TPR) repeat protein
MLQWLRKSSWPEARAALERAKGRLGDRGTAELRRILDQGTRDLELATRLEVIRMDHARGVRVSLLGRLDEYEQAFREAGLGQVHDDPEVVAGRVRASNIRDAILAALDHVSSYSMPSSHASWALNVARRADPDPTGWRDRARDPVIRADEAALVRVIETAPVRDQSVSLLLALEKSLKADSHRLPFLIRIQQAHPGDFWANRRLGDVLRFKDPGQAIRYYQAAVSIRPRMALGYHDLGMVLAMAGRTEEAVEPFRRAVELDPTPGHSLRMLVVLLSRLGRHDEAINHLRVAIRRNPDEASLHTALGQGLEVEGRHAEALAEHQQAVTLDPKSTESQRELRTFLMRRGRLDEMRVVWQRAIEANPLISRLLVWVCRAVLISRPGG